MIDVTKVRWKAERSRESTRVKVEGSSLQKPNTLVIESASLILTLSLWLREIANPTRTLLDHSTCWWGCVSRSLRKVLLAGWHWYFLSCQWSVCTGDMENWCDFLWENTVYTHTLIHSYFYLFINHMITNLIWPLTNSPTEPFIHYTGSRVNQIN